MSHTLVWWVSLGHLCRIQERPGWVGLGVRPGWVGLGVSWSQTDQSLMVVYN